jgi:hypothetical protein
MEFFRSTLERCDGFFLCLTRLRRAGKIATGRKESTGAGANPECSFKVQDDQSFKNAGKQFLMAARKSEEKFNADRRTVSGCPLETFDVSERFRELRKTRFFRFEFAGVDAAAQAAHFNRVLKVQHFVVEQVLQRVAGA